MLEHVLIRICVDKLGNVYDITSYDMIDVTNNYVMQLNNIRITYACDSEELTL